MDTLDKYGQSFQTKAISILLKDVKLLDSLFDIIDIKYFESQVNEWIVETILEYYSQYKTYPTPDVFKAELVKLDDVGLQKRIIEQLKNVYSVDTNGETAYIKKEFSNFCKNQKLKSAILESVNHLKVGNYDQIKVVIDNALQAGGSVELGHDYKLEFDNRMADTNRVVIPTGWDIINDLTGGGLGPGELGVVVGASGVGKTWVLCALAAAAVRKGLTVVHYTMELSEFYVGQRYDTIFSGIPTSELRDRKEEVYRKIKGLPGKLLIKYIPPKTANANTLQSHIERMSAAGNKPELVIIDYADLMVSLGNKSESTYLEQGGIYIDLRGMLGTLQIPAWTGSQAQRSATSAEVVEADKIADSYAKVMNADFIMSVSRKSTDKVNYTARVHIMKNRFGMDGMTFSSKMDTNIGVIEIFDTTIQPNSPKTTKEDEMAERQMLHQKYKDIFKTKSPTAEELNSIG